MSAKSAHHDNNNIRIIQKKNEDNGDDDGDVPIRPAPPSLLLDLASSSSRDGSVLRPPPPAPMLTLRKRRANADTILQERDPKGDCPPNKFAIASYNSAFLQGIFEDIADANEDDISRIVPSDDNNSEEKEDLPTVDQKKPETVAASDSWAVAAVSEYNLAKRRRISTVSSIDTTRRSLGLCCGKSQGDLVSYSQTEAKTKGSSLSFLPTMVMPHQPPVPASATRNHLELPATVSTSYSFQSQEQSENTTLSSSSKAVLMRHGGNNCSLIDNTTREGLQQLGDFGWYVDTDYEDGGSAPCATGTDVTHPSTTVATNDLAFSACIAPRRADPTKDHKAEVEWAAAADMVDDVLGGFF